MTQRANFAGTEEKRSGRSASPTSLLRFLGCYKGGREGGAFVGGNILRLVLAGWWLAILHLTALLLALTIIGIPPRRRQRQAGPCGALALRPPSRAIKVGATR